VDKNASYPAAVKEPKSEGILSEGCELRQVKYLNNIVEQDHRFMKRRVKPGLGFKSFHAAARTLKGYEIMNMIRKGQCDGAEKGDIGAQIHFIENLFASASYQSHFRDFCALNYFLRQNLILCLLPKCDDTRFSTKVLSFRKLDVLLP
ncbi:transposase, partial [bacterium]|nr:transposase [bacterium]